MKRLLIIFILLGFPMAAYCTWNPKECLSKEYSASLDLLQDPDFVNLKAKVISHVHNDLWHSEEKVNLLMDIVLLTKPENCVEVGTYAGASFLPIAAALRFIGHGHAFAIDPWSGAEALRGIPKSDEYHNKLYAYVNMDWIHQQFLDTMENWSLDSYCTSYWAPSGQAIDHIDQIDFLHLDGNYSEEGALLDAQLYLPKVLPGGYILLSHVFIVVDKKCTKMKALWYLLDRCEIIAEIPHVNGYAVLFRKS